MSEIGLIMRVLKASRDYSKGSKIANNLKRWVTNRGNGESPKKQHLCANCREPIETTPKIGLEQYFDSDAS